MSVARALADSAVATADVPWRPAHSLARHKPSAEDLHTAIAALTPPPVSEAHAAHCFARLMIAFEPTTRASGDETRIRLAVWLEANRDLGDALWSKATLETIRSRTFMPRPAEFRAAVASDLEAMARKLARCREMLDALAKPRAKTVEPEPLEVRLATIRDSWRRLGNPDRAARAERELAKLEQRLPISIDQNLESRTTEPSVATEPTWERDCGGGAANRPEEWDAEPE